MEEIKRQIAKARRRLVMQQFVRVFGWTMFAAMIVAVIGLAIPKIWPLAATSTQTGSAVWMWSWIGGALALGIAAAIAITYFIRRGDMDAAVEVDRRFGLKERVSSVMSLAPQDLDSEAGQALLHDASRRVQTIEVGEEFSVSVGWRSLLPVLPAIVVFLLAILGGDAVSEQQLSAKESRLEVEKRVKTSEEQFRKQILGQRKKVESNEALKELAKLLKEIDEQLESTRDKKQSTRSSSLLKLNNIKRKVEAFKKQLGDPDKLKDQLNELKDANKGPAEKAIKAMQRGDFGKATQELKKLAEQLRKNELNEQQQEQLREQIAALQEQLNKHKQAKQELQQQIDKAKREGNDAKAKKLQQELERLEKLDEEMQQAQDLADKLSDVQQNLAKGNGKQAADQLDQLADQLQDMQDELDQLESQLQTLDQVMDQIAQAKNAMGCKQCNGKGCTACQGQGNKAGAGGGKNDKQGPPANNAKGQGPGAGFRPEAENNTGFFESKVDADVKQGTVARIGEAGGANISGLSREQAKQEITSDLRKDPDPLNDQPLPKGQREHTKEYFELFRKANQ